MSCCLGISALVFDFATSVQVYHVEGNHMSLIVVKSWRALHFVSLPVFEFTTRIFGRGIRRLRFLSFLSLFRSLFYLL